jgi:phosphoglycolate phosphatase
LECSVTGPVVGFDLDLTLVDSAPGIVATMRATLAEFGITVGGDQVRPSMGLDLADAIAMIAPGVDATAAVTRYRELYLDLGVPSVTLLPGAWESMDAVHALGGRTLVASAKAEFAVHAVLARVGLDRVVDEAVGGLFGADKGHWLRETGAEVYVGDHPGDIEAARVAGAMAVAVATGPYPASALAEWDPDVLLPDLTAFPAWLTGVGRWDGNGTHR